MSRFGNLFGGAADEPRRRKIRTLNITVKAEQFPIHDSARIERGSAARQPPEKHRITFSKGDNPMSETMIYLSRRNENGIDYERQPINELLFAACLAETV